MKKIFMLAVVCFVISVFIAGLIQAQPPFQTQGTLNVEVPIQENLMQNQSYTFRAHVFNETQIVRTTEATCFIHIYNPLTGNHTAETIMKNDTNGLEWYYSLNVNTLKDLGQYSGSVFCNTSLQSGFSTYPFYVTPAGHTLDTAQILLYIFVGLLLIGLLILCMVSASNLQFKNIKNRDDEVIQINWRKYLKIFCWSMSYFLLLAIIFLGWNLTWAYSDWNTLSTILHYLFRLLYIFALPVFIGIVLTTLINYLSDKKINKFIQRTGLPYNEV